MHCTVRAANMSPVPEKKRGSWGVSMRKRRGVKSEVAVEPMIVRFSTESSSVSRVWAASFADCVCCDEDGVLLPDAAVEAGALGEIV